MRTIYVRALAMGAFVGFTLAAGADSRTEPPEVLNALEVQQLVTRGEPAGHARLSAHFSALAKQYAADAKRHKAMSLAFGGNPNRQVTTGARSHFARLAELNAQSATILRELAAHHEALAAGSRSTIPRGAARFEGGASAAAPTKPELRALAAEANTPADHRGIEEYFLTLARKYSAAADEHVAMAHAYRGTRVAMAAAHCDRLIALSRDSAKQANAVATLHRQLAVIAQ